MTARMKSLSDLQAVRHTMPAATPSTKPKGAAPAGKQRAEPKPVPNCGKLIIMRTNTVVIQHGRCTLDQLGEDGVNYINLGRNAKTPLGQAFSPMTSGTDIRDLNRKSDGTDGGPVRFRHPTFGAFQSFRHFLGWVSNADRTEDMRFKHAARRGSVKFTNFYALVAEALYELVMQNPWLVHALANNDLPFDSVIVEPHTGELKRVNNYIVGIVQHLQRLVKENRLAEDFTVEDFKSDLRVGLLHGSDLADAPVTLFRKPVKLDFQNG